MEQENESIHKRKQCVDLVELPDHIIHYIFLKLPVEALVRFATLSKQWQQIINTFSFKSQHLRSITPSTASCNLICSAGRNRFFRFSFTSTEYNSPLFRPLVSNLPFDTDQTNFDMILFNDARYHSSNGLLCVLAHAESDDLKMTNEFICIWNPATGKYRKVMWPPLMDGRGYNKSCFMGSSYEPSIDDYKIVVLYTVRIPFQDVKWRAKVMAVKENIWRNIDFNNTDLLSITENTCGKRLSSVDVNGDIYWIVRNTSTKRFVLLKFNMTEESLNFVALPEGKYERYYELEYKLATLNGFLYLFVYDTVKIDIWMLRGDATWCNVNTILTKNYIRRGSQRMLYPVGFNQSGHVIMVGQVYKSSVVHIFQDNKFVELDVENENANFHFVQMESLVSP